MPYSKYAPDRPFEKERMGTTPSADRRAKFLRWGTWLSWAYTALGFGLIVYWLARK